MRKLVVALCLLMEASTGNAQFILPPRPSLHRQVLFQACLQRGANAEYCECWANQLGSRELTSREIDDLRLFGRLPQYDSFKLDAAHIWCKDYLLR